VFEVLGRKWYEIGINPIMAFLYGRLESMVLSLPFDAYYCISKNTMKSLEDRGIPPQKLFLTYPGIDYDLFNPEKYEKQGREVRERLGLKKDTFVYTFYGRPGFTKGVEFLVRSVPYVKEKIPSSKLLLILSQSPERGYRKILALIEKMGLKGVEELTIIDSVPREELPYYIHASDCIVIPSLSEGFGFTCVEACTMKIPVVATDAGSLPEVIFGRHLLVRKGDPLALALGIEGVYRHEYAVSEDKVFLWEDMVRNCSRVYEDLIDS
jgi:glycosyltransferase involved in cell wall biosynthesis